MDGSREAALFKYLKPSRVDETKLKDEIIPHLLKIGFNKVGDLQDLDKSDLEGFDKLTQRRIWQLVHGDVHPSFLQDPSDQIEEETARIYVRYILCKSDTVFVADIEQTDIKDIDPSKTTLAELVSRIRDDNKIPDEQAIEMYSSEGYPLQNNEITNKASLTYWGITDGTLFYVMIRLKEQPGIKEFVTLPGLDHDIGTESFTIETLFSDNFKINAYMDCDSPEDIAQKVYSIIDIPVPYISLFVRRGYTYERLSAFTELKENDNIRVVLRNPQEILSPRSAHYGVRSYNPIVKQTECGLMKFFSILKFLCSTRPFNKNYDFEKFLSYLMGFTKFPPLVYAFRCLKENSFLSLAGWTALTEGCYFLFKAIFSSFAKVEDSSIFEYSDYVFAILIEHSESVANVSNVEYDLCSLVCPLSGIKICKSVFIKGQDGNRIFDKDNVLAKIKESEDFSAFGLQVPITSSDAINDDNTTQRLLMYNPWDTDRKVCVWINPPKEEFPMTCKKLRIPFVWFDMVKSLRELCIVNPGGLYCGDECITYNGKSQLMYFLGSAKGNDERRKFYNPCCNGGDYMELIFKVQLERIGSLPIEQKISCDIGLVLKQPHSYPSEISKSYSIKVSSVIKPQDSITWEPEEAIVVLLDHSYSMIADVFSDMKGLKRIDAAKELFSAFATRTQAYKLHHAIGLTLFSTDITVKLKITTDVEKFEANLKGVEPTAATSLTDAVVNAVNQLRSYNCPKKRILCLTDGFNNGSTPYSTALNSARDNNIIVDTVLLTYPEDNYIQKALSHATGGFCIRPKTLQEALKYFEMDAMLSLKERVARMPPKYDINHFANITSYPYETEQSFKSTYIQSLSSLRTCSTKSFVDKQKADSTQQKRIMKELMEFIHNPHDNIIVYPSENDFNKWKVLICGPSGTAYEGGNYVLSVDFPVRYPFVPPDIRFLTFIYHCNISGTSGRICHTILSESYTPSTSMRDILSCIYGLLMCPDTDTSLDSVLVDGYGYQRNHENDLTKQLNPHQYFDASKQYFNEIRANVRSYASKQLDVLKKELSGE